MLKEAACQSTRNAYLTFSSYWLLLPPTYNTHFNKIEKQEIKTH